MSTSQPAEHPLRHFRAAADRTRPSFSRLLQRPRRHPYRMRLARLGIAGCGALALLLGALVPLRNAAAPAPVASSLALNVPSDQWFLSFDADPAPALSQPRWPTAGRALSDSED